MAKRCDDCGSLLTHDYSTEIAVGPYRVNVEVEVWEHPAESECEMAHATHLVGHDWFTDLEDVLQGLEEMAHDG